ncbi:MAG TPA: imidazole glycerol phosphate synthase subunit HisH [Candidatus Binatia bacterium]|nr:imidazole glycerol phosphate synthase subunit HisH [Candidatus Binatia bacterium]
MIAIVDYGVGNLRSAAKGLERAAADAGRDVEVRVTTSASDVERADAVVLPGVGAFGACMSNLDASGLRDAVVRAAGSGRPFLGVCVGMQILFEESSEFGPVAGLGVLPGKVVRFRAKGVKIPHMGWNALRIRKRVRELEGLGDEPYVYFVHSYYAEPSDPAIVAATAEYGGEEFTAAVARDALFATQFHPEKSQLVGLKILASFVRAADRPLQVAVPA